MRAVFGALLALAACKGSEPAKSAPPPPPPPVVLDAAAAGSSEPERTGFDDSIAKALAPRTIGGQILDAQGRPARDVVVYVKSGLPASKYSPGAPIVIDQRDKAFVPRVAGVLVGGSVTFKNSDPVLHNVYSRSPIQTFDLGAFGKPDAKTATFDKPGRVDVFCAIHTNMHAIVHVLENPYFAITDERGAFAIPYVPVGQFVVGIREDLDSGERESPAVVSADRATVLNVKLEGPKP